jgi:hypothetical protein
VVDIFHQRLKVFTSPLVTPSFREEYLKTLRGHVSEKDCTFCAKSHTLKGEEFCAEIENKLAQAWDVKYPFRTEFPASESTLSSVSAQRFSLGPAANLQYLGHNWFE